MRATARGARAANGESKVFPSYDVLQGCQNARPPRTRDRRVRGSAVCSGPCFSLPVAWVHCCVLGLKLDVACVLAGHMRQRPRLRRSRWRLRLTLVFVAACALLWLRFYRRVVTADAFLAIPARWPACRPDGGSLPSRLEQSQRHLGRSRLVIVSTWLPTRCGIATYSAGLRGGLLATGASVDVVAVHLRGDEERAYYGPEARGVHAPHLAQA